MRLAWQARDRLNDHDLAFVETMLGPNYPAPYPHEERLVMRRRLVDMAPDRAEYRHMYADRLYHWHAILGLADGREQAAAQFRRALEADSSYTQLYQHLVPLLYSLGESREAERVARAYLRREPDGVLAEFLSWRMAAARGDAAALDRLRRRFDTFAEGELLRIYAVAVQDGLEVEDAERALRILLERGTTPAVRSRVLRESFVFELLRGRPAKAVEAAEKLRAAQAGEEFPLLEATNTLVVSALHGDGDSIAASRAVANLSSRAFGPGDAPRPDARVEDLCTVARWRLWHGDRRGVEAAVERLRSSDTSGGSKDTGPVCALLLEAIDATLGRRSDAAGRLARLDSALVTGPQVHGTLGATASLAAAQLHERRGDAARALAAVRRRFYDFDSSGLLLATSLRTEGRLAAEVGDTEGAMRAYRHYLALRSDPEPILQPQADSVRAALAALERGPDTAATP
jgi:tetratricopeptide (TPR) repeat protein